jgi:hypothetical protein
VPLPVQALDHATGYIMAASVLRLLARRLADGTGGAARLSLARTAALLTQAGPVAAADPPAPETEDDLAAATETTSWGPARRLRPALDLAGTPMHWARAARRLGTDVPAWAA